MKASVIYRALRALVAAKQPVFIWGGPGIGKSAIVRHLAADSELPLQDVRALLLDPVDLRGLPFLGQDGRSKWATPEFLPQGGSGILFLDELNAAPAMVQAGCYQLVLDRKLGEYTLPEGWAIIAAGNRDSDRAVTTRMPTPLRNRFVHLEFEVDLQDWSEWAIEAGIRPEVIAFLRFRQELLSAFDRDANAFPSPRSWEFVSRILDATPDQTVEHELFCRSGRIRCSNGILSVPENLP
jgi:MoxR-like ATPase